MKLDADRSREQTLQLSEEAWEWLERLEDAGPEEKARFAAWLAESPRHVEEFLFATSLHREFEGTAGRHVDVDALLAEQRSNVRELNSATTQSRSAAVTRRAPRRWLATAAGLAAVAGLSAAVLATYPRWLGYSTETGEQRALELPDGSIVHLNTRSRIKVNYSGSARDLQLVAGEALFQVAREAERPFRVRAGSAVIQALGTQFNVYRRAHDTSVAVLEGSVRVSTKEAGTFDAGQAASIAADGKITRREANDTEKASAWRQRRLVFRSDELADVAAEFNRYNRSPQIRVDRAISQNKKITGVFNADDPELLLTFLGKDAQLRIEREGGEVVIRPPP